MKRREFITLVGGAAAAWPLAARAQQGVRVRRIGILLPFSENDSIRKPWYDEFRQGLAELGWTEGRNLRIDTRWDPKTAEQVRISAKELVDLRPDVLVTSTIRLTRAVQQLTQTIPIVFVGAGDPLASGLVASLSRPQGNTTGVTDIFRSIGGKWLELLKECVPSLASVALIFNPDISDTVAIDTYEAVAAQSGAQYGVRVAKMPVRNAGEIERGIAAFAKVADGGLIILPPPFSSAECEMINRLAVRYRLPVIYQERRFAAEGGLLSYGTDIIHMFRHGGSTYVDRILRGAKPSDLPVQFPTKFLLVVNLKTSKAMGLTIPEPFLVRADEVIE
jgi:putative ABC transport system substrate-binding protein